MYAVCCNAYERSAMLEGQVEVAPAGSEQGVSMPPASLGPAWHQHPAGCHTPPPPAPGCPGTVAGPCPGWPAAALPTGLAAALHSLPAPAQVSHPRQVNVMQHPAALPFVTYQQCEMEGRSTHGRGCLHLSLHVAIYYIYARPPHLHAEEGAAEDQAERCHGGGMALPAGRAQQGGECRPGALQHQQRRVCIAVERGLLQEAHRRSDQQQLAFGRRPCLGGYLPPCASTGVRVMPPMRCKT